MTGRAKSFGHAFFRSCQNVTVRKSDNVLGLLQIIS